MTDNSNLGNRCKELEKVETGRRLFPQIPIVARLDGRSFSKLTKGMDRPFDRKFSKIMQNVTLYMVQQTNALCGYTQSDEISLVWLIDAPKSQIFFNGKVQKMVSVLAGMCSAKFIMELFFEFPMIEAIPHFDCRVWNVPTVKDAVDVFTWRERDATKNSISMLAQAHFSHKQLHKKHTGDMQDMLMSLDPPINWNNQPEFFKRGSYFQRVKKMRKFSPKEIEKLPLKHEARANPDLMIERSNVDYVLMPPMDKISNKVGVIFRGEDPITYSQKSDDNFFDSEYA